jgi:hypothetical protein
VKTRNQRIKWGRRGAIKRWSLLPPFEKRFWERVNRGRKRACWVWKLGTTPNGYGKVKRLGKTLLSHRVAFELHYNKQIPDGVEVLHKCDNKPCCNPYHLFLGTQKDNVNDAISKGRMWCPTREKFKKLSDEKICEIRNAYQDGHSQNDVAERFGVHQSHVSKIVNFKRRIHS